MSYKEDYITYRINLSHESMQVAKQTIADGYLVSAVNRLYYACFYLVDALLFFQNIQTKSHAGAKNQFSLNFIKNNVFDTEIGQIYSELFDIRHKGDYDVFVEIQS